LKAGMIMNIHHGVMGNKADNIIVSVLHIIKVWMFWGVDKIQRGV